MRIAFLVLIISLVGCEKSPIIDTNQQWEGNWKHVEDNNRKVILQIQADSKGFIEYYENNAFISDTQPRKWFIKNNTLYFGWLSGKDEKFSIDLSPTIANSEIIQGLDTVHIGQRYVILNGDYYVD